MYCEVHLDQNMTLLLVRWGHLLAHGRKGKVTVVGEAGPLESERVGLLKGERRAGLQRSTGGGKR
jgi:hypothetical protein